MLRTLYGKGISMSVDWMRSLLAIGCMLGSMLCSTEATAQAVRFQPPEEGSPREHRPRQHRVRLSQLNYDSVDIEPNSGTYVYTTSLHCHNEFLTDVAIQFVIHSNPSDSTHRRPTVSMVWPETTSLNRVYAFLRPENDTSVYETAVVNPADGIVQIPFPPEAPSLDLGQTYSWGFAFPCGRQLRPDSPFFIGCVVQTQDGLVVSPQEDPQRSGASGSTGMYIDCPE